MSLVAATLDDKYELDQGRVFLTGIQALVRLPMMQRRRDLAAGLNTACFVSGYRGSPLGGLDQQMQRAKGFLDAHHVRLQTAVNEDLAATAIWGSQQLGLFPGARYDGVFGMWYGKGPGVDRSGDVLKHANLAGTAKTGGVLCLAGDDHTCKSSTTCHQTEYNFMDAMIPVLSPAGVQEFLDLGLHGWAMSRFTGCWTAFKIIAETADSSASVHVDPSRLQIVLPDGVEMPQGGLNLRWPDDPVGQEERLHRWKLPAVLAYARANRLDRVVMGGPRRRLGIVTTGKSYLDVRQALEDLGLDERSATELGLSIYKVALVWPLEPEGLKAFAAGLDEVFVVEEKRPLLEAQVKDILYHLPADRRPLVTGKTDEAGRPLLKSHYELSPGEISRALAQRLGRVAGGQMPAEIAERLAYLDQKEASARQQPQLVKRTPYFCSGCPHNTSTNVPEGSRALAGIGCHFMSQWMDRSTDTFTHMGGEGVSWVGQAPFTDEKHVFINIGDGTYYHSGILAIRQSVAAGVNATYKVLYNDAVAMTGGQHVDGTLTADQVTRQLAAEGVRKIVVVTDEPEKYPVGTEFAHGATVRHRDDLDAVQKELREHPGVTAIVYDQTCAAEKRRRRKRGTFPDPQRRVFINEAVCEGCGDCSVKSNCVSVVPVETEFGRKRAIDQSSCNKDYSCLKGFCPSFVTVEGGGVKRPKTAAKGGAAGAFDGIVLPDPVLPPLDRPWGIMVTGIGGTGVVTIGALLGMAAHLDGKGCSVLDMTGLAQKGGAVLSHIRIGATPEDIHAVRLAAGGADALIGCDMMVSASPDVMARLQNGRSHAVVNAHETITGEFTRKPDMSFMARELAQVVKVAVGEQNASFLDASRLATALLGDSIATNPFMLGYAWQKGLVPISGAALERAIELNGVAVEANKRAFLWGRRAAADLARVEAAAAPATPMALRAPDIATTPEEAIARRRRHLVAYQGEALARRFDRLVARVREAEAANAKGRSGLVEAVAKSYHKLLAYKDEYEVARLYTDGEFLRKLRDQFEGGYSLSFHLAPPLLARRDPATGHLVKQKFGPWMMGAFRLLAGFRKLRGTALDPFGYTAERRRERALIGRFEKTVETLLAGLDQSNHAMAVEIAALPQTMRGFGHIKDANIDKAEKREAELLAAYARPVQQASAAE